MRSELNRLHGHIESALPRLLWFVEDLDVVHEIAIQQIGAAAVQLIGWAWLHRAVLGQRSRLLVDDFPASMARVRLCIARLFGSKRSGLAVS
jgi:hypothetical protein